MACVIPNAEAFCFRGSSRLGQGNALEALDDCYRALSLLSLEVCVGWRVFGSAFEFYIGLCIDIKRVYEG